MSIVYVPALLSGLEHQVKNDKLWNDFDAGWFTDRSIYYHPHLLTSYYYAYKIPDYKKALKIKKEACLWTDSGGFSVATKGKQLDPREVLAWQEDNADIAFILDFPPANFIGGDRTSQGKFTELSPKELEEKAIKTARNSEVYAKYRTPGKMLLYNIIQGSTLKYMDIWWKHNGHFPFEGHALGTRPSFDALFQASKLAFLHSKGVRKRVHMLGLSGLRVIPAIAWMSKHVDWISFDSTSYGRGSLNRTYFLPHKINSHISFGNDYVKGSMKKLPCKCPVCILVKPDDLAAEKTWPGTLIALHNLYIIRECVGELNASIDNETLFRTKVTELTGEPYHNSMTAQAIEFFELYLSKGIDEAYLRYFPGKTQNQHTQRALF